MELKPGYKQTEVGVIPEDWKVVLLDSVAQRGSGHTPSKGFPEYWGGSIKWISLQDSERLDQLYISETAALITPEGLAHSSAVMHSAGTVVLSRDAGVGKSAIMREDMAVSQHFMAWKCGPLLNNYFLYYWLQLSKPQFERIAVGNTIKTIGLSYFRELFIPLPPLPEQEAIAAALSDVDVLLGGLDELLAKKRDLKQGAMQELLTGKRRLPGFSGEWETKRLGDIGKCLRGVSYNGDSDLFPHDTSETKRLLRSNNIQNATVNVSALQFVDKSRVSPQQIMQPDDILVCMANGSKDLVGKTGFFKFADGYEYTFGAFMGVFRTHVEAQANYVFLLFQTAHYRKHITNLLAGSSINNLRPSSIETLEFPMPSLPEQAAISTILSEMDDEIAALKTRREKTRSLKAGLMQNLLTGAIRLV